MDLSILKSAKKLITHEYSPTVACHDGIASALIIKDAMPDIAVEFVQYNTPAHMALKPEPGVLFCDMTPYVERAREKPNAITARGRDQAQAWVDAGAVVLDHHDGAVDLVAMFGDRGVYGSNAKLESGAYLAFREIWWTAVGGGDFHGRGDLGEMQSRFAREHSVIEELAYRVAIRDTWAKRGAPWRATSWRDGCVAAAALCFWPRELLLADGLQKVFKERLAVGEVLVEQQAAADQLTAAQVHRLNVEGLRVAVFQGSSREASDVREILDDVDLVLAFGYTAERGAPRMKISARSHEGGFPCHLLAQAHNGNGHPGAAGFALDVSGSASNPYTVLHGLLLDFEARRAAH